MGNDQSQLNPGSSANDFQPTTRNPQDMTGSNVQSATPSLQPVQGTSGQTGQQLYQQADRQPNLSVQLANYSANSLVSVQPTEPRSNNGILAVTGALAILLIVVIIVRRYWRALPATLGIESETELAELQASVPAETVAQTTQTTTKAPTKKKSSTKKHVPTKKKKRTAKKK